MYTKKQVRQNRLDPTMRIPLLKWNHIVIDYNAII